MNFLRAILRIAYILGLLSLLSVAITILNLKYNLGLPFKVEYSILPLNVMRWLVRSRMLSYVIFLAASIYTLLFPVLWITTERILSFLIWAINRVKNIALEYKLWLSQLPKSVCLWLLAIILLKFIVDLYFAISVPITYDEAWTYTYFTRMGFFTSISYYRAPNNHIFFSILTTITNIFPFDPLYKIRAINIVLSLIVTFFFFRLCSLFFSNIVSLICTLFFTFLYMQVIYSFMARGYELVMFCSLLATYSAFGLLRNSKLRHFVIYTISSIIGFYTMPSFLYFFVCINMLIFATFLLKKNISNFKKVILINILIILVVYILYIPVILRLGFEVLSNNKWVQRHTISFIFDNYATILKNVLLGILGINNSAFGAPFGLIIVGVLLSVFFLFSTTSYSRIIKQYAISFFVLFPIITILHRAVPFPRTWVFLLIPIALSFGAVLNEVYCKIKTNYHHFFLNYIMFGICALLFVFELAIADSALKSEFRNDYLYEDFCNTLKNSNIDIHKLKNIYSNEFHFSDMLIYDIYKDSRNTARDAKRFTFDSISINNYDIVILLKDSAANYPALSQYKIVHVNESAVFAINNNIVNAR